MAALDHILIYTYTFTCKFRKTRIPSYVIQAICCCKVQDQKLMRLPPWGCYQRCLTIDQPAANIVLLPRRSLTRRLWRPALPGPVLAGDAVCPDLLWAADLSRPLCSGLSISVEASLTSGHSRSLGEQSASLPRSRTSLRSLLVGPWPRPAPRRGSPDPSGRPRRPRRFSGDLDLERQNNEGSRSPARPRLRSLLSASRAAFFGE